MRQYRDGYEWSPPPIRSASPKKREGFLKRFVAMLKRPFSNKKGTR